MLIAVIMSIQIKKRWLTKKMFYTDYMKYMHAVSETLVFSGFELVTKRNGIHHWKILTSFIKFEKE